VAAGPRPVRRWKSSGPATSRRTGKPLEIEDWQREGLSYLVEHEPHDWCDGSPAKGIAFRGAKGIGKGVEDAWIIWWLEACFPVPERRGDERHRDNLRDNLWKELAVWYGRAPILQKMFEIAASASFRGRSRDLRGASGTARRGRSRRTRQGPAGGGGAGPAHRARRGGHRRGGSVPPGVLHAAEGIHANPVHSLVVLSGNCDSMEGALYDATVKRAHRYHVIKVTGDPDDPKCSKRIDKEHNRQLIADYGRNDPVVLINVLGEFPATGVSKLLGPADIEKAVKRRSRPVVRAGGQGRGARHRAPGPRLERLHAAAGPVHFEQRVWRIPDLMLLADQVAMRIEEDKPDALIVLATGIGWGVVDRLKQMGYGDLVIAVDEGTDALDGKFANRRAEMWWHGSEWVKHRGQLLKDPELHADLQAMGLPVPVLKGATRLLLDPAEDVRARLGRSPDKGTSLVGTFAAPVAPKGLRQAKHAQRSSSRRLRPVGRAEGGNDGFRLPRRRRDCVASRRRHAGAYALTIGRLVAR
jgi:hypothetical protein